MPTNGVPSSVPLRSFAGASAGSASPFAFAQSRALAPAASQTAIAAPRVDPLQSAERTIPLQDMPGPGVYASAPGALEPPPFPLSPFSAPVDLSVALGALGMATRPDAAAPSTGMGTASAPSVPGSANLSPGVAGAPPPWAAVPAASHAAAAPLSVDPIPSAERADPRQRAGRFAAFEGDPMLPELSPFSAPVDSGAAERALSLAPVQVAASGAPAQNVPPAPSVSDSPYALPREASVGTAAPTAAAAAAPSVAIVPVFAERELGDANVRRRLDPQRFSDPAGKGSRPPPDLARQRRDDPKAAGGHRPAFRLLRAREFERPPRRAYASSAGDRRLRGGARQGPTLRQRVLSARNRVRARHDRRHQSGRAIVGPPQRQGRRRDRRHLARASCQYRALAAALSRDRRAAAGRAGRRQRRYPARRI